MKILLLGVGLQGKAALYDLARSPDVSHVIAADADIRGLTAFAASLPPDKVTCVALDARNEQAVSRLMQQAEAVIVLLPAAFRAPMARLAVENRVHFVDASYTHSAYEELDEPARQVGVAILPEFGLDPGIDHILAARALSAFDEVHEFHTYGAGIPAPAASHNPIRYKISWTFAGVLNSYSRPARLWRDGRPQPVAPSELFHPANVHHVNVEGFGPLEAYPNGDVVPYLELLGIAGQVQNAGRYSMRWPGHADFWGKLSALGLLDDEPVPAGGGRVSPRQFLHDLLAPQLQYAPGERDAVIVRVEVRGRSAGRPKRVVYQVVDYRDLDTGFLAMQRTVGFTASIGAQMILRGDIAARGLLSPLQHVPPQPFLEELSRRGIQVECWSD